MGLLPAKREKGPVPVLLKYDARNPVSFDSIRGALEKIGLKSGDDTPSPSEHALSLARDWVSKGKEYTGAEQYTEAIDAFNEALRYDPEMSVAWILIGNSYFELGNLSAQIEAYEHATTLDPASHDAWFNLGNALCENKRFEDGLEAFHKAIELNPADTDAWHAAWFALTRLGRTEEAAMAHDKILDIDPDYPLDLETLKHSAPTQTTSAVEK